MYRKALVGQNFLYFVYAPPQTDLDNPREQLPKKPHANATRLESSVYYYWWAFLKLHKGYIDCCQQNGRGPLNNLYRDFGDVRPDDFKMWWIENGSKLFSEPKQSAFVEALDSPPPTVDLEREVLLRIPLKADLEQTLKEIRLELQPKFENYRKIEHFSEAKYKVHTKPVLSLLHNILMVRKAKNADSDARHYELADRASLKISVRYGDTAELNKAKSRRVNEYLEKARSLIKGVGEGRFPDYGPPRQRATTINWDNF